MDHIDKVATASVLSVYSVAKEMIIMKRGVLVGKFEPQRAQRTQREVATVSVYSVAKEMIIMKSRVC